MDLTPEQMLQQSCGIPPRESAPSDSIMDESIDPDPSPVLYDPKALKKYLSLTVKAPLPRVIPPEYAESATRSALATALIDAIWKSGHFRLGNLAIEPQWKWDSSKVGAMAAFYRSVEVLCESTDYLGVKMCDFLYADGDGTLSIKARLPRKDREEEAVMDDEEEEQSFFSELPFEESSPRMGRIRKCPAFLSGEKDNWLIYIPFDTGAFRLGGSLLSQVSGLSGGLAMENPDWDYFLDCYEIVREMVEDGIVVSGATVSDGGLLTALGKMIGNRGANIDVGPLMRCYAQSDPAKVLFGEVPGAIIEIRPADFDYIDAEFLLQDVAYHPIGHPTTRIGISVRTQQSTGLSEILQALMESQAIEGED